MHRLRSLPGTRAAAVAIGATLALAPAAVATSVAFAQSAGDDQYTDPLLGEGRGDGGGEGTTGEPEGDGASGAPAPEPAAPTDPAPPAGTTGTATPTDGGDGSAATLPRTGAEAGILGALGVVLLAAGAVLRQRAGGRARA
ncbi:MAG: LPXTG cell wall anchor domain-containing protein [Thermoleophilaceae bacterium]